MTEHLGGRPVWLAASTHDGEEHIVLEAHRIALRVNPRLLLILAPRHPNRGDEIAQMLQTERWRFNRRTAGEMPDADAQVYLADTMGEMGLWIRLACGVYLGGGTARDVGGHNPIEILKLDKPVASGRLVFNFDGVFAELEALGVARFVDTPAELAHAVTEWQDGFDMPELSGWKAKLEAPMLATLDALRPLLPEKA